MLDEVEKIATDLLTASREDVRKIRDALLAEVTTDDGRYAARTALKHPEGSTTPLNEAADRTQQTYAKVREQMARELPKLLALILAEKVARQRRDEAAVARDRHWDAEYERRAVGPHPETRDLFGRLFAHGVTPWHLKALRDEEVAIIADLIRWKANDARHRNAETPWQQVLQIYSNRLILEAGTGVTVKRSRPGMPVRGKRYTSPKYYMFNELVEAHWGLGSEVSQSSLERDDADDTPNADVEAMALSTALAVAPDRPAAVDPSSTSDVLEKRPSYAGEDKELSPALARVWAEIIYNTDPYKLGIYWPPQGIDRDDYDPDRLVPALEAWIDSGAAWTGAHDFLDAAQRNEAREFIAKRRQNGIDHLAKRLLQGEERAIEDAREAGLLA